MMQSAEIRQTFLDFFKSKGHAIVPSAPIVIKDDPTLLFTNAGMNQFKDYFLGNKKPSSTRVADTQKCLRVSGKHNDLEEVGVDTYHHTMFEMLGNWSFGDYFKEEAIAWAWELLTEVYKIDKDRLYVTVFEGDVKEGLPKDDEAISFWKKWIPEDRIIMGKKKDNFWEMGDTGPCGPCTEIHIDSRTDDERKKIDGKTLVNADHPQVIEIWNLVFIQYNRKKDGTLEPLPAKHVDTGMGFERLVRVLQNKHSNYDTDIFTGTIAEVEKLSQKKYGNTDSKQDVAFRVIADHIRAICFTIADGQMPSNTGAGYVIRRILRRAVRYYFSYLDVKEPSLYKLVPLIAGQFKNVFPELEKQKEFVGKVVKEEEESFLRTLEKGIQLFEAYVVKVTKVLGETSSKSIIRPTTLNGLEENKLRDFNARSGTVNGEFAFELNDTYGFPIDLTQLMAKEIGWEVDINEYYKALDQQKSRSRAATAVDAGDWIVLNDSNESSFVGYDTYETTSRVLKYRKTKTQGKEVYQIVLDKTPFYAESGGQVGDTGYLTPNPSPKEKGEPIMIFDTKKENNLTIHFTNSIPKDLSGEVIAKIDVDKRKKTAVHHSATHLLHAALRKVLGTHVQQKGSLVNDGHLRFDFSHFAKVTDEEIKKIESLVNEKIRENIPVVIKQMKKGEAIAMGAMALFGEKYGDVVRVVIIDPEYSIELCGGTHVGNTGELGFFQITTETAVGAGVRRIEAVAGQAAENYITKQTQLFNQIKSSLGNPPDIIKSLQKTIDEKNNLSKRLEAIEMSQSSVIVNAIMTSGIQKHKDFSIVVYDFDCYSEEIFNRIFNVIRARIANSIIILGAHILNYDRVRIFLNSKDNNYSMNLNPEQFKDFISDHINLIQMRGGPVILDVWGNFKSNLSDITSVLQSEVKDILNSLDNLFKAFE